MLDQRAEVICLLELLGIADLWHVVRPLPGQIRDQVLIQNEARDLNVEVPFSSENIQDLPVQRKIAIIRIAIVKACRYDSTTSRLKK